MYYKITVKTTNDKILTFNVTQYEILKGGLIRFIDKKTNKEKIFDTRNIEIERGLNK